MAVTKNPSSKKNTPKATKTVEPVNKAVEVETVNTVDESTKPVARPKQRLDINRDELIACRASVQSLVYVSKRTGEKFEWSDYGDILYITFGELITMKSTQPRMLKEGWLIVDDEDAIEQLGLAKMYGNLFEIDDVDEFFDLPDYEIERILKSIPRGLKNSIATFARERIETGQLDSNRKIKLFEDLLDVDLKIFE